MDFRNRFPELDGHNLYFWCFAPEAIAGGRSADARALQPRAKDCRWPSFPALLPSLWHWEKSRETFRQGNGFRCEFRFPSFAPSSIYEFRPEDLQNVIFHQGRADGKRHTLIIDEIRVGDDIPASDAPLPAPQNVHAIGYDRHVEVRWDPVDNSLLGRYVIYRSLDGKDFEPVGIQLPGTNRYSDFLGKSGVTAQYKVAAADWQYRMSAISNAASASTREFSDDELLTMLQEACFHYYWEGADPHSGMTRENIPGDDRIVATGASGMGIAALIVGVDRGFITRAQGLERLTRIVDFLEHAQRYHGAWSHFMDGNTGKTMPVFGMFDNGGDLVETSFLMEGLLAARQYFHGQQRRGARSLPPHLATVGDGRVGLVSRAATWRLSLLALVGGVGMADSASADRLQRSHDYVSVGDVVADARRSRGYVLLRMGEPVARRAIQLSRRLVAAVWMEITTTTGTPITESSST